MKFTIELSKGQAKDFLAWVSSWYEYDQLDLADKDFRNAVNIVGQISDQLEAAENDN